MVKPNVPSTLLDLVGVKRQWPKWSESILLIIDAQREYAVGKLKLWRIEEALKESKRVLDAARAAGAPVIHVLQISSVGAPIFDPSTVYAEPTAEVAPIEGEATVVKAYPNSFTKTDLAQKLAATGRKHLVVIGFMTHMCLSTTVRAAIDYGYSSTVVAAATTTRDLPDGLGGVVNAEVVKRSTLAALNDRFAMVVPDASGIE
jgi:nicotinamidase-related amidase